MEGILYSTRKEINSFPWFCYSELQLMHKQMYWIRTNLRRFQPSNVKCKIRMLIFHYIMEYFDNLSGPCPLHEQPKDEII